MEGYTVMAINIENIISKLQDKINLADSDDTNVELGRLTRGTELVRNLKNFFYYHMSAAVQALGHR